GVRKAGVETRQFRLFHLFLHLLISRASVFTLIVGVIAGAREKHDGTVGIKRLWASSCRPQYPRARRPRSFLGRDRRTVRQRSQNAITLSRRSASVSHSARSCHGSVPMICLIFSK